MSKLKKVVYTNEPIGKINLVSDFLPDPRELVLKQEAKKTPLITLIRKPL
jgi:hypothetical protein